MAFSFTSTEKESMSRKLENKEYYLELGIHIDQFGTILYIIGHTL